MAPLGSNFNIFDDVSIVKDNDQGFSLIESLIAIIILGILMAGGLAFYYQANALYYRSLHSQMATWVADSRMEEIKNVGCSQAEFLTGMSTDTSTGTPVSVAGDSATSPFTPLRNVTLPGCSSQCTVSLINGTPVVLNPIIVNVSWTEPGETVNSNQHSVSLQTCVKP